MQNVLHKTYNYLTVKFFLHCHFFKPIRKLVHIVEFHMIYVLMQYATHSAQF